MGEVDRQGGAFQARLGPEQARAQALCGQRIHRQRLLHITVKAWPALGQHRGRLRPQLLPGLPPETGCPHMPHKEPGLAHMPPAKRAGALAPIHLFAVAPAKAFIKAWHLGQPMRAERHAKPGPGGQSGQIRIARKGLQGTIHRIGFRVSQRNTRTGMGHPHQLALIRERRDTGDHAIPQERRDQP